MMPYTTALTKQPTRALTVFREDNFFGDFSYIGSVRAKPKMEKNTMMKNAGKSYAGTIF